MSIEIADSTRGIGRAALHRLRWWWQVRMGWPGLVALAMLVIAAALSWVARPGIAERERNLLREQVSRLDANVRVVPNAASGVERDPRDLLRDGLPSVAQRGRTVAGLLMLLGKAKVQADRAEYSAEDEPPGLVRMRIVVPVKGSYAATRETVATVLNALPHAALDGMVLERDGGGSGDAVSGQLRFSVYFRKESP